ncbi:MAG TPA: cryptochrome/photolyase family protein [Nevskia sp.]|nr:cryptochrome/photolyase family protein [Nevskia sp.]
MSGKVRNLVLVLGDQLDPASAALDGFDAARDRVWMCEAADESRHVWSHKARIALFLSAMRHHAVALRARGLPLLYHHLDQGSLPSLRETLRRDLPTLRPERVVLLEPGEWRLRRDFEALAAESGVPFEFRADRHFLCSREDFAGWMEGRRQPRLEHFYRWMRVRGGWLMQDGGKPAGGRWNYDADNRSGFGAGGPGRVPPAPAFRPDAITEEVLRLVAARFSAHPGGLDRFDWPVTRAQALSAMRDFMIHRLPRFGPGQDAMWAGEETLWHSRLSAALNLHLLQPREVCAAAERAWREGAAPLASAEGFIRQILGWREYVRGIYWQTMPGALEDNALGAEAPLPAFYWTGDTPMNCLRQCIGDTLRSGYAHHIQRLMVTGLYALLLGVRPRLVHEWYLAVYVDAVEWVELPNTLGMSQHADGGRMASKPYIASGRYIQRMSNYCRGCRFDPALATGDRACPFTTLYWDFLDRHRGRFAGHPRLGQQVLNLGRKPQAELAAIRARAAALRAGA